MPDKDNPYSIPQPADDGSYSTATIKGIGIRLKGYTVSHNINPIRRAFLSSILWSRFYNFLIVIAGCWIISTIDTTPNDMPPVLLYLIAFAVVSVIFNAVLVSLKYYSSKHLITKFAEAISAEEVEFSQAANGWKLVTAGIEQFGDWLAIADVYFHKTSVLLVGQFFGRSGIVIDSIIPHQTDSGKRLSRLLKQLQAKQISHINRVTVRAACGESSLDLGKPIQSVVTVYTAKEAIGTDIRQWKLSVLYVIVVLTYNFLIGLVSILIILSSNDSSFATIAGAVLGVSCLMRFFRSYGTIEYFLLNTLLPNRPFRETETCFFENGFSQINNFVEMRALWNEVEYFAIENGGLQIKWKLFAETFHLLLQHHYESSVWDAVICEIAKHVPCKEDGGVSGV